MTIIWPMQCKCGHIFMEKYQLPKPNEKGEVGFCWCGFCRTKRMVREYKQVGVAEMTDAKELNDVAQRRCRLHNSKRKALMVTV